MCRLYVTMSSSLPQKNVLLDAVEVHLYLPSYLLNYNYMFCYKHTDGMPTHAWVPGDILAICFYMKA